MADYQSELYAAYDMHSACTDPPAASRLSWFREYVGSNYMPQLDGIDPSQAEVLEIGCNKGFLLRVLHEQGFSHLHGIDLAQAELEQAERLVPTAELGCADAHEYLSRRSASFDVIIMKAVLEHVHKDAVVPMLRDIATGLKQGGVALVDVPNMDWLFAGHERYMDFTHEVGFTQESLRQVTGLAFGSVEVIPLEALMPGPLGRLKRSVGRAVLHTLLSWADADGGAGPIWQRSLLAVCRT